MKTLHDCPTTILDEDGSTMSRFDLYKFTLEAANARGMTIREMRDRLRLVDILTSDAVREAAEVILDDADVAVLRKVFRGHAWQVPHADLVTADEALGDEVPTI